MAAFMAAFMLETCMMTMETIMMTTGVIETIMVEICGVGNCPHHETGACLHAGAGYGVVG